jgi:hypothetical protein
MGFSLQCLKDMCVCPGEHATDEPRYWTPQAGPGPRPDQANRKQPLSNPEIDIPIR